LQFEVEEILQDTREAVWLELEMEWAKFKAQQIEESFFALFMNAMAKAIKVLQDLVFSKRETSVQLSLELREVHKEKGAKPSGEVIKAMKT